MPRLNLSISQELYDKIAAVALDNQKTVNHEVVDFLEKEYLGKTSYDYSTALDNLKKEAAEMPIEFTLADLPTFKNIEADLANSPELQPTVVRAKLGKMFNEEIKRGNVLNIERATQKVDGEERLRFLSRAAVYINKINEIKEEK